ncbi:MAG TPA: CPBP family glutamic-type intramembrane protease [Planctomycetaceae bacterium]
MATVTVRKPRRKVAPEPPPAAEADRALAAAEAYWAETRRPFVCLLFLAPLLIAYEVGVLWLGDGREELLRNGADAWMRSWLYAAGVHQSFVLPLVVMALLLVWNFYGYFPWRVRPETLGGMLAESLIFAFALVVAGQASELICRRAGLPTAAIGAEPEARANHSISYVLPRSVSVPLSLGRGVRGEGFPSTRGRALHPFPSSPDPRADAPGSPSEEGAARPPLTPGSSPQGEGGDAADETVASKDDPARRAVARAVTFVGAGIYEEVLFRLLLLPACYAWFRLLRAGPTASATLAVLATSLMFALAHYVGPAGDTLVPYTFCFRAAAGAYFAVLFVARGFGVTVGTHAVYDLIVGVLWAA